MTTTHAETPEAQRARLRSDVTLAARVLPTHYPLETFIAVNPLAGLETMPFEQAIRRAADLYGTPGTLPRGTFRELYRQGRITDADLDAALMRRFPNLPERPTVQLSGRRISALELMRADLLRGTGTPEPVRRCRTRAERNAPAIADIVDTQAAKWCSAFFGGGAWPMPGREDGFFAAWRALAPSDPTLPRAVRAALRRAPERADDAALQALAALGVDGDARIAYLQAHLTRMPGWAAHVHWCGGRGEGIDVPDYLAMRLTYEAALLARQPQPAGAAEPPVPLPSARDRVAHLVNGWGLVGVEDAELTAAARVLSALPVPAREMLWQNAFESHYRDDPARRSHRSGDTAPDTERPRAQVVTLHRHPLRRSAPASGDRRRLPDPGLRRILRGRDPLHRPARRLRQRPVPGSDRAEPRHPRDAGAEHRRGSRPGGWRARSAWPARSRPSMPPKRLWQRPSRSPRPRAGRPRRCRRPRRWPRPSVAASGARLHALVGAATPRPCSTVDAMPLAERVLFAQVALTTMGLVRGFGRLVVLCGHGSATENNPYQAALDCGACGGQAGGPNARTAAPILNQPQVRDELRETGHRHR